MLDGPLRFYWRLLLDTPRATWEALGWIGNVVLLVGGVLILFNRKLANAVSAWHGFSPWWAIVPFGALVLVGLLRANYKRFADLHARIEASGASSVMGGPGGPGPGGGGGGGAAVGQGAIAHGGKGGTTGGPTVFEMLARASLGMGYPLDEFFQLAGFDSNGYELDQIGAGGDGGSSSAREDEPGQRGGDGLAVIKSLDDDGHVIEVAVFHAGNCHFTIQPRQQ
jgi:hypothetical protein